MHRFDTIFGLAFDVEKSSEVKSGFKPAQYDLGAGKDLFGDLRLEGFAALLRLGVTRHLTVIGGKEGRYKEEDVYRAEAITAMLIHDHGIDSTRLTALVSASNTGGNIARMQEVMMKSKRGSYAVVSNHYHLPRAALDLQAAGLSLPLYAAEAFLLMEDASRKNAVIERLGGGPLAERMTEEIQGVAHKLSGTYKPKTDVQAPAVSWYDKLFKQKC